MILGLRTTIYKVTDMAQATAWYAKAFGKQPYFDEPFYVGFNIGGYELGLHPDDTGAVEKAAGVVTYWGVEDVDAAYRHFLSNGATEDEAPMNVGGEIVVATVKDPWGNAIGLIFNPHFSLES